MGRFHAKMGKECHLLVALPSVTRLSLLTFCCTLHRMSRPLTVGVQNRLSHPQTLFLCCVSFIHPSVLRSILCVYFSFNIRVSLQNWVLFMCDRKCNTICLPTVVLGSRPQKGNQFRQFSVCEVHFKIVFKTCCFACIILFHIRVFVDTKNPVSLQWLLFWRTGLHLSNLC